ncbi:arylsulfatase D-like isoform X2 [Podarcis lilfordi]|nr:arylsulfatase D-like isoform X2 [Podarcis lilfordi]
MCDAAVSRPNVLLIMADDLGYGDLGCFGNDTLKTPNIDQLAREGVKLTQQIAAASLCTPSRAAFLTGRYPIRSGMVSRHDPRVFARTGASGGLPVNETTFAKLLQQQGYTTGLIGKWHQGMNCESHNDHCHHPLNHGFDYFYGTPFTLVNECQANKDPEMNVQLQATYWFYTQMAALLVFSLVLGRTTGLFYVKWKIIAFTASCGILFFISWFANYGFVRYWNCIMLRDHIITQQPIKLENAASRILKESTSFIKRVIDGRNQIALLQGAVQHSEHEFMFHYCGSYLHAVRWYQKESGTVWKVHYTTPIFNPEGAGACYGKRMCPCSGEGVTHHDPPLLFDLSRDPSEAVPLSPDMEPLFHTVLKHIGRAVEEHRSSLTPVPQQLSSGNNMWKPWLQPCCGTFPFCWCDNEESDTHSYKVG